MKRIRAGYYTAQVNDTTVDIEYMTTAYGDSGWFVWIAGERSDAPLPTKRDAMFLAQEMTNAARRVSE